MEFKKWLHLENNQYEAYEEAIAAYTFYHFQQAVNKFFSDGKRKRIEEYMKESWGGQNKPNNHGGIRFYLPPKIGTKTVLPKEMVALRICVDLNPTPNENGAGATQGHGIIGLHYNPETLQTASSPSDIEVQNIIATIQYQLYHEVTHLMSGQVGSGAKIQTTPWWKYPQNSQEYRQGQLNYYTDAGEVKAHARQYAIMYMNKYPGQKYNPQLLVKLAQELKDNKMMRYAQKLGNPNIQRQFPQFAQKMQKAHELFQGFMQKFVSEKGYKQFQEITRPGNWLLSENFHLEFVSDINRITQELKQKFPWGERQQHALSAAITDSPRWFDKIILRDENNELVGIASIWKDIDRGDSEGMPGGNYLRIGNIATIKPGIGREFIEKIKELARRKNAGIFLSSTENSYEFYKKLGFREGLGATFYMTLDDLTQQI